MSDQPENAQGAPAEPAAAPVSTPAGQTYVPRQQKPSKEPEKPLSFAQQRAREMEYLMAERKRNAETRRALQEHMKAFKPPSPAMIKTDKA